MMSRKELLRSRYRWQIHCSGEIYDQNMLLHPSHISGVDKIELIPQYYGLEVESVIIPSGAIPVFYFTCREQLGGEFEHMIFHIGYEIDGERFLKSVLVK